MLPAEDNLTGRTLGHYRIERQLGKGGMGVLYLARDARLGRPVAIKVLPGEPFLGEARRKRFVREAKAASALNHPNIITVYNVGSDRGVDFIAMEYVEGEPLSGLIREGLPIDKAVGYAQQIAGALAAAHEAGIIHRDLKPANIMVSRKGQVKLLDFGLAKLAGGEPAETLASRASFGLETEPGVILGTIAYMSPEQAAGQPVDARSDIFSFGSVLYEMVTGQRAFAGKTGVEILGKVLREDPPPASAITPGLPSDLERIVERCLRKDPERRSQHMADVKLALDELPPPVPVRAVAPPAPKEQPRRWTKVALVLSAVAILAVLGAFGLYQRPVAPVAIGRIAVLPLDNISGDAEQDYFADGMTEALIDKLGRIGALHVTSRTSVMRYKGASQPSLKQIADELTVDALVDGSAVRVGDQVRVTAQLIDARTDDVLWSDSYDRPFTDVLVLQSEIAQAIAEEIRVAVTPEETQLLTRARPVDSEAYELYLRGRYAFNFGPAQADSALQYYQLALKEDPNYGPVYTGIAAVWAFRGYWGFVPWNQIQEQVRELAAQALRLDDSVAATHHFLATFTLYADWDWSKAAVEFQRALELDASAAGTRFDYGLYLTFLRRWDEAAVQFAKARELDPLNPIYIGASALPDLNDAVSIPTLKEAIARDPSLMPFHQILWGVLAKTGDFGGALKEAGQFWHLLGYDDAVAALRGAPGESGYREAMRRAAGVLVSRSAESYVSPYWIALTYAQGGDSEAAFAWLERAFVEHRLMMPSIRDSPHWAGLRNDPRFQDIVRRVHYPE
jgi:eukaryotic-like serine/threonine-protein kinase